MDGIRLDNEACYKCLDRFGIMFKVSEGAFESKVERGMKGHDLVNEVLEGVGKYCSK